MSRDADKYKYRKKGGKMSSNNKKMGKYEPFVTVISTIVIIVISIISLVISISAFNISNDAYKATIPFQLPILDIEDSNIQYNLSNYILTGIIQFEMSYNLTNRGKGIATNVKSLVFISDLEEPSSLILIGNTSFANDFYPDVKVLTAGGGILNSNFSSKIFSRFPLAFIIRFEYQDYATGKLINRTCWGKINKDSTRLIFLTGEEKNEILPYYLQALKN